MSGIKLWLDDRRPAPSGWTHVRTVGEAIDVLSTRPVAEASLDHDLGECGHCVEADGDPPCGHATGATLVAWMALAGRWPLTPPAVHSGNPTGAARMRGLIASAWHLRPRHAETDQPRPRFRRVDVSLVLAALFALLP